jgi:general secretion pathway protein D
MRTSRCNLYVVLAILGCVVCLAACTGMHHYRDGLEYINQKQWGSALAELEIERAKHPDDVKVLIALDRAKAGAASQFSREGQTALNDGQIAHAEHLFKQALMHDHTNALAQDGMRLIRSISESDRLFAKGRQAETTNDTEQARTLYEEALQINPGHQTARESLDRLPGKPVDGTHIPSGQDIQVSFAFDHATLPDVFRALAAVSGLNILIDDSVDPARYIVVELNDVTVSTAIQNLTKTYGLLPVPLKENTVLITVDTPENRSRYAEESVTLFTLKYADCEEVKNMLFPMLKSSVVLADKRLNSVLVRTDPSQMSLATELINSMDRRESEVLIELEVLEITRGRLQDLGLHLGDNPQFRMKIGSGIKSVNSGTGALTLSELRNMGDGQIFLTLPSLYLDLLKQDSHTRILAQPRLRILNRTPAKLHVGEKVPIKVTTSRFRDTSEETSVYEYKDVGILMELTPKIISDSELAVDLKLEVSSIVSENQAGQPTIGTREIITTLRLNHDETELIAGLIKDEERTATQRIPLVGDIPVIGRFFSSVAGNATQSDIVIALTPHVMDRNTRLVFDESLWTDYVPGKGYSSIRRTPMSQTESPDKPIFPVGSGDDVPSDQSIPGSTGTGVPPTTDPDDETTTAVVFLSPATSQIPVGSTTTVSVMIDNAENVGSTPFYLEYDPGIIDIDSVTEGSFLSSDGEATAFMSSIDTENGRVIVGLTRLGAKTGISGSGDLIRIELKGTTAGKSELRFTHNSVKDPWTKEMPSTFEDGSIDVIQ